MDPSFACSHELIASLIEGEATEQGEEMSNYFYGRSFITNHVGDKIAEAGRNKEEVLIGKVNLDEAENLRNVWGVFRDRRTDLYNDLLKLDGSEN